MTLKQIAGALRTGVFWIHLSIGVTAGTVILIMSLTGVLLGYERQIIAWWDGAPRVVAPAGTVRLPLDSLIVRAGLARQDVASMIVKVDPAEPVTIRLREPGRAAIALDPYTGGVLSSRQSGRMQAAMTWLRGWHRWLGVTTQAARPNARAITGAANLGFLFIVLSGFFLWWPRRWTVASLRSVTWFSRGLRGKARDFNWHNAIGFWSAIPLAIVVASAVFMSYQWPGRLLDRFWGTPEEQAAARLPAPATASPGGGALPGSGDSQTARAPAPFRVADQPLDELAVSAQQHRADWRSMTITMPAARDTSITLLLAAGNTYRPDLRTTVLLDPTSGTPQAIRSYQSLSTSRKIRSWYRFGHTGEIFGLVGQTVATVVSAGGVVLVWTGISLALRRLAAWRRRRSAPPRAARAEREALEPVGS